MRVLIDLTSLDDNFSGIELYAMSVARELIKDEKNEYILVFKNKIHNHFTDLKSNVRVLVLKGKNKLIFNQFILPWNLRNVKADFYLFLAFTQPFFWFKKTTLNAIHDMSCWDCPGSNKWYMILYWKLMFWRVSKSSGDIVTVSEFSKKRIVDILKVNPNKVLVTYSAPLETASTTNLSLDKLDMVREKYNLPDDYFLCLSTLEPRKNLTLFINAYSELLLENKTSFDVVLAGRKGWMIDSLFENMPENVKHKVHFTGFIADEDLPYIYKKAKVFVFPSLYEGFGVPPVEAMLQGTIVVASDAASIPEVLGDGPIYFKNNDFISCKNALLDCLELNNEERTLRISKGLAQSNKYSWKKIGTIIDSWMNNNRIN